MAHEINRREMFKTAAVGVAAGVMGTALPGQVFAQDAPQETPENLAPMPRKSLGGTGETVPILLLGGSQNFDTAYDRLLHRAHADGVTYIDTAVGYANGLSHGQLAPFIEQIGRKNVWLTSKVMLGGNKVSPETYRDTILAKLPEMRTDYLDMFFMHSINDPKVLGPEYIAMAADLKKRGIIKYFGFSCHLGRLIECMNAAAGLGVGAIDCIQFKYNFASYGDVELNKAIDACKKAGIGLIAMKTQASVPEDKEEVVRWRSDDGFSLHQAKLKAVWADERIDAAVSEMTNMQMLRDNGAAARSTRPLSAKDMIKLNHFAIRTASTRCNGCNHLCENAVQGDLKIADTLRFLMYHECYGKTADARRLYGELTAAERDFANVDLSGAMGVCPQRINIRERLAHAQTQLA
ncbi:MAG: aldo/keto reductase [Candidatus Hydrogenedentota bacterium]